MSWITLHKEFIDIIDTITVQYIIIIHHPLSKHKKQCLSSV